MLESNLESTFRGAARTCLLDIRKTLSKFKSLSTLFMFKGKTDKISPDCYQLLVWRLLLNI